MILQDRRDYMGYTIGRSILTGRWVVRYGRKRIGSAPSAFDAVELIDEVLNSAVKKRVLQGDIQAAALLTDERPGRREAILGKNPSLETIAESIARASLAVKRGLAGN
jgi:hypothetical protein